MISATPRPVHTARTYYCDCPRCASIEADDDVGGYIVTLTTGDRYVCRATRPCGESDDWTVLLGVDGVLRYDGIERSATVRTDCIVAIEQRVAAGEVGR